jgi:hypothetical protein
MQTADNSEQAQIAECVGVVDRLVEDHVVLAYSRYVFVARTTRGIACYEYRDAKRAKRVQWPHRQVYQIVPVSVPQSIAYTCSPTSACVIKMCEPCRPIVGTAKSCAAAYPADTAAISRTDTNLRATVSNADPESVPVYVTDMRLCNY